MNGTMERVAYPSISWSRILLASVALTVLGLMSTVSQAVQLHPGVKPPPMVVATVEEQQATPDEDMVYVIHAGGAVDGHTGSNSLEALEATYAAGERFIEMDFNWTTDGALVCIHDFCAMFSLTFADGAVSEEQFMATKIYDRYTAMNISSLALWLEQHPDVYIITDIKESNVQGLTKIATDYPQLKERFIPQIYAKSQLQPVQAMGYEHIILTLYEMTWAQKTNTADIARFAQENELFAICFNCGLLNDSFLQGLKSSGVKLFTHTVNDRETAQRYLDMGLDGIYTDGFAD